MNNWFMTTSDTSFNIHELQAKALHNNTLKFKFDHFYNV
jgi:hypothetical protein